MKLLQKGSLSPKLQPKDLLGKIFQSETAGLSLLRFTVVGQNKGELYFNDGRYIVYALLSDDIAGVVAVKQLMQLEHADFAYYVCDTPITLPPADMLNLDVQHIIGTQSNSISSDKLSTKANELLDKVFNIPIPSSPEHKASQPIKPVLRQEGKTHELPREIVEQKPFLESPAIEEEQTPVQEEKHELAGEVAGMNWDLVEPLVADGASQIASEDKSGWAGNLLWTTGVHKEDKEQPSELRGLSTAMQWQRTLRALVLILTLLFLAGAVLWSCAWLFMKMPPKQFTTRRFSIPVKWNLPPAKHPTHKPTRNH